MCYCCQRHALRKCYARTQTIFLIDCYNFNKTNSSTKKNHSTFSECISTLYKIRVTRCDQFASVHLHFMQLTTIYVVYVMTILQVLRRCDFYERSLTFWASFFLLSVLKQRVVGLWLSEIVCHVILIGMQYF